MTEVIFYYNTIPNKIKCKPSDIFRNIVKKFISETHISLSDYTFLYDGKAIINFNLKISEIESKFAKEQKQMTVIVIPIERENEESEETINKNNSTPCPSPKIEELFPVIADLKKEIAQMKESNNIVIKMLNEEVKSLKNELLAYKGNDFKKNEMLKQGLIYTKVNNAVNADKLQNRTIGNAPGCVVTIQRNRMIDSNIIFTRGMIIAWFGLPNRIPENWAICDGTNGTPDLRNRFIIGSSDEIQVGEMGGNYSVVLRKENLPPLGQGYFSCDSHHGSWHHTSNSFIKYQYSYSVSTKNGKSDDWGSNFMIDLNEGMNSSPINILNPYFSLFYIMKL